MITLSTIPHPIAKTIPLSAIIDTALCVGAGGSTGSTADKSIVRNVQGQLIIPGSQLKGRLRHECEKLARSLGWWVTESPIAEKMSPDCIPDEFKHQAHHYQLPGYPGYHCFISQIFGNPILPSRLIMDDLVCEISKEALGEVIRPGVSINRSRRTAEDQKLFFLETSPSNAQLLFTGQFQLLTGCPDYAEPLIAAALTSIHALGGSKSAGLGWLHWRDRPTLAPDSEQWSQLTPPPSP